MERHYTYEAINTPRIGVRMLILLTALLPLRWLICKTNSLPSSRLTTLVHGRANDSSEASAGLRHRRLLAGLCIIDMHRAHLPTGLACRLSNLIRQTTATHHALMPLPGVGQTVTGLPRDIGRYGAGNALSGKLIVKPQLPARADRWTTAVSRKLYNNISIGCPRG